MRKISVLVKDDEYAYYLSGYLTGLIERDKIDAAVSMSNSIEDGFLHQSLREQLLNCEELQHDFYGNYVALDWRDTAKKLLSDLDDDSLVQNYFEMADDSDINEALSKIPRYREKYAEELAKADL